MWRRSANAAPVVLACALVLVGPAAGAGPAEPPADLRLVVNVPAFRLDVLRSGERIASYPVTVGSPRQPTPEGRFAIEEAIWNPWWYPPPHRRPAEKVTPPGPHNPVGRVKLPFSGLYRILGTETEKEIGRATSRGCVRLRNRDAIALGRLLHAGAGPDAAEHRLDELIADPGRTRSLRFERPVPLEVSYELVEIRDGQLEIHADVYRRAPGALDRLALAVLEEAGLEASRVDRRALRRLVETPGSVPLRDLLEPRERSASRSGSQ